MAKRQIHSPVQSRGPVDGNQSVAGRRPEGTPDSLRWHSVSPNLPRPWASAQPPCLLRGWPQHRAASGPLLPRGSRVPGKPLPWSARPAPGPVRKRWPREPSHPWLAGQLSCPLGCPAQLPQLPPGMGGTEEGPKPQALPPASTCSPLPSRVPGSQVLGAPLGILLVSR